MPVKCVFLLLQRLFYGVTSTETIEPGTNTIKSDISVSYDNAFSATSQRSKVYTRNLAAINALQDLCEIDNKFVKRQRNDVFPPNFAGEIQKYVVMKILGYSDRKRKISIITI